jgi:hypothetical protein
VRKEDLHNALMHPENLTDDQLIELRETVARFPYFGAAQIALTRAFKARGDIRFTDQLSQAAIYTGHRASLYNRIKSINSSQNPIPREETIVLPIDDSPTLASIILDDESSAREIVDNPISQTVESVVEVRIEPEIPTSTPITIEIEKSDSLPEIEEEITDIRLSELDTLEAQILITAVNTSIEMEVQPAHEDTSNGSTELIPEDEPIDENSYAALIYRRAQQKHLLPEEKETPNTNSTQETEEGDDLPAFRATPLSHGIQRIRSTDAKQHQRDLIDRFIHTEPQIARGKAGEYPTGNLAKESLEDDFSMVTETIAILFAKQGKLDKARKAFRKLMEQHPEKSIYFAAQLKNLEHFKK